MNNENMQQMQEATHQEGAEILPGLPQRVLPGEPKAIQGHEPAGEGSASLQSNDEGLCEQGQDKEGSVLDLRGPGVAGAPSGLRQSHAGDLGMQGVPPKIAHRSITDDRIQSYGYDEETETLEVRFAPGKRSGGALYRYQNVPRGTITAFESAASALGYLNTVIAKTHEYSRVAEAPVQDLEAALEQSIENLNGDK